MSTIMCRGRWTGALRAGVVVSALVAGLAACDDASGPKGPAPEATAGKWKTWVLPSAEAVRPAPPPSADSTRIELDQVVMLQRGRTTVTDSIIRQWDGLPTEPWNKVAFDLLQFYWNILPDVRVATPALASRVMALVNVAIYDALVATYEAKATYKRSAPAVQDARVRAVVKLSGESSYPSEHAAAAEAAAAVLAHLFPGEDTAQFHVMAREAGTSRILAGAAFPSDVEAGAEIGRQVAARVIARARTDGASAPWTGSVPPGEMMWRPTPPRFVTVPFDAMAGSWRTWVIPSGSAFRPAPPPARTSATFTADLAELVNLGNGARTVAQANLARYWATDAPSTIWERYVSDEIVKRRYSPLRAARAHALTSVAMYDAFVACWEAKFHYWLARPVTVEPAIKTVFSTPPFPSYPSGHSTVSSAAAVVFADLFPDAAAMYHAKALEASFSRVWAGVHYRFDVLTGDELGAQVGKAVVTRAKGDGSGL